MTSATLPPVDFAALLCSRLCHDLLSPVGALNNGIELLEDEQDESMRAQCMELLADSARTTAAKLKFFRLACGAAGGYADVVESSEARAAIDGLTGGNRRIDIGWMVEAATLPKPAIKVLLNLVLMANDVLIRGGRMDIGAERVGDTVEIVVRAEGQRLVVDGAIGDTLAGKVDPAQIGARGAPAWLVHEIATGRGGHAQLAVEGNVALFGATLK